MQATVWNLESRRKLAVMIQKKSVEMERKVFQEQLIDSYDDRVAEAHRRISDYFCPLGFESSHFIETRIESNEGPMLLVCHDEYLFFHTTQGQVIKIKPEIAERFLVLGF